MGNLRDSEHLQCSLVSRTKKAASGMEEKQSREWSIKEVGRK